MRLWIVILTMVFLPLAAWAQEAQPGDSCATYPAGSYLRSGGPEITDGYILVCDGANWASVLEYKGAGELLMQIGDDAGSCTATKDGRMRYDGSWQYCDGGATTWKAIKQPQCGDDDVVACYLAASRSSADPDLIADNIKSGVNILGVTGNGGGAGGIQKEISQLVRLTASDAADNDWFGRGFSFYGPSAVAVDGDTAVIGAYGVDGAGTDRGAAYVFERASNGTWSEVQILTASDAADEDMFGKVVAIEGDTIVVGAHGFDGVGTASGAAYVYQRASNGVWGNEQKLTASDALAFANFGDGASVDGDTIMIGAHWDDGPSGGFSIGAAYVYQRANNGVWGNEQKLTASDKADSNGFGSGIAVDGDTAVIGAALAGSTGQAYVFERASNGTWSEIQILTASDKVLWDWFGQSTAIAGDTIIVGAYQKNADRGAAYVYQRASNGVWGNEQKLTANAAADGDRFGTGVAIAGDKLVVGAPSEDGGGTDRGAAYVYQRASNGTWSEVKKFTLQDAADDDEFGQSVTMADDTILVGAFWENLDERSRGAAYMFYPDVLDNKPAPFDFMDQGVFAASSPTESNDLIRIEGILDGQTVSISGTGGSPEYRICSDYLCTTVPHGWTSANGSIDNNEYLQLRITSPASVGSTNTATITVGSGSDNWGLTTQRRKVFVTSTSTYKANGFGGVSGADTECSNHAATAGLSGSWVAWISDSSNNATTRLVGSPTGWELLNGSKVVDNEADLIDGTIDGAINRDENNVAAAANYWTGTTTTGVFDTGPNTMCDGWTFGGGGSKKASMGSSSATDGTWTDTGVDQGCSSSAALLCFEQ